MSEHIAKQKDFQNFVIIINKKYKKNISGLHAKMLESNQRRLQWNWTMKLMIQRKDL